MAGWKSGVGLVDENRVDVVEGTAPRPLKVTCFLGALLDEKKPVPKDEEVDVVAVMLIAKSFF